MRVSHCELKVVSCANHTHALYVGDCKAGVVVEGCCNKTYETGLMDDEPVYCECGKEVVVEFGRGDW